MASKMYARLMFEMSSDKVENVCRLMPWESSLERERERNLEYF